ncbi:MAG: DNA recombination protein RmuC [Proteobacteria bacterium]|nr:DNA recombination protein RmuC [Pseudomonadota bacterium]
MPEVSTLILILLVAVVFAIVLLVVLLLRRPDAGLASLRDDLERALRDEQREGRGELRDSLEKQTIAQSRHQQALSQNIGDLTERTDRRLDEFRIAIAEDGRKSREEQRGQQQQFSQGLSDRLRDLTERNAQVLGELRTTLETQLKALQDDSAKKLEQMRATVDEKLQSTLETRLGESFRLVSERLEAVQRGLGEMQQLATGVGDLKRVLTNVKTRGTFGEVQLGALLEQVLTLEQYAGNVETRPGSNERVEYAVRLPGGQEGGTIWLPIDAKFPHEDYERLLDAQERGDAGAANDAGVALERRIRDEAKKIRDKYIEPPHTTDFALLFLPTEGLYAEVLRRPGLFDLLQRELRITPVGPTTLLALLNSLQMGFRTLAIEKRSSEVWQTLGAVKSEFGKFGASLDAVKKKLAEASNKIDETGVRSRAIERKLRGVEALPQDSGDDQSLLGLDGIDPERE